MKQNTPRPTIYRQVKFSSRDFWESPTLDELAQSSKRKTSAGRSISFGRLAGGCERWL